MKFADVRGRYGTVRGVCNGCRYNRVMIQSISHEQVGALRKILHDGRFSARVIDIPSGAKSRASDWSAWCQKLRF